MQVRQSLKFIIFAFIIVTALEIAVGVEYLLIKTITIPIWAPLAPFICLDLLITVRLIRALSTRLTVEGGHLRWESGLVSKATRTVELEKIQDVRVDQSLGQRMMGIGDLSLETAGGSSRIVMRAIDQPQPVADHILELARQQRSAGPPAKPL